MEHHKARGDESRHAIHPHPSWWSSESDSAWDRVKQAFRRDWEQTKHDLGSKKAADLDQDVPDTLKQAAGKQPAPPIPEPTFEEAEPAFRYGYGARRRYLSKYPNWNAPLEDELRRDFGSDEDWKRFRTHVRSGYEYSGT